MRPSAISSRIAGCAGIVVFAVGSLGPRYGAAETRPLWEFGLGPGVVRFSDYPGSLSHRNYLLPFPYIRYRGKFLRSDRDGVRGIFVEQPRVSLNVSCVGRSPRRPIENSSATWSSTSRAGL